MVAWEETVQFLAAEACGSVCVCVITAWSLKTMPVRTISKKWHELRQQIYAQNRMAVT